jgi:tRNA pseudouridine55 synthase
VARSRAVGLDGVLVVDKPAGPTSHDVVGLVRRLSATRRVGHGGTLDPFATGVLPLFLGHATRLAEYHLGAAKAYRATICFGAISTTDDLEGELTPAAGPAPDRAAVEAAGAAFHGSIEQTPPAYSAIKVAGRRAYALARAGRTPELRPRQVTIERLAIVDWDATDPERPIGVVDVECSAGTYVRALARDLGAAVGSGAYLGALTRTASGPFRLEDAVSLDAIRSAAAAGSDAVGALLRPLDAGLEDWPSIDLDEWALTAVLRGQAVRAEIDVPAEDGRPIRLLGPDGRLVAVGRRLEDGRIAPDKVVVDVIQAAVTAG